MLQASLAAFTLMVSNGTLAFALPLNVDTMGLNTESTGILLSTFGIVALIVFLSPINRIYNQFKPIELVITGFLLIGVSLVQLNFLTTLIGNFFAMVIYDFGFAFIFPSMNRIVADASAQVDRGKAYGIFYAFFSLGAVASSTISGATAQTIGHPFLVSAVNMFLTAIILLIIMRKMRKFNK